MNATAMQANSQPGRPSKGILWTGRVMSAIPVLLILFGSVMKLMKPPAVVQAFAQAGIPEHLIVPVGLIELICVVVYSIPSTSVLGAILITGLMGGATIINLRIGNPAYLLTILLGMLAWGGLYLRDPRLRVLIPLRTGSKDV